MGDSLREENETRGIIRVIDSIETPSTIIPRICARLTRRLPSYTIRRIKMHVMHSRSMVTLLKRASRLCQYRLR